MIILFDLDSTLVSVEGCDVLAEWKGVGTQVAHITQQTMDGDMDFDTAFPKKLDMIAPSLEELDRLGQYLTSYINPEWKIIVKQLLEKGYHVGILSQGYTRSSLPVAKILNISSDRVFAISFNHTEDGNFKSLAMSQDLMYHNGKPKTIETIRNNYPNDTIVFVGDSVGDMEAGTHADLFIGYTGVIARPKMIAQCNHLAATPTEVYNSINTFSS